MTLIDVLKKLPGAGTVRRVGTDSLTPTFAQLLPMAFPNAELVDAEPALRAARRIKTIDEMTCCGVRSASPNVRWTRPAPSWRPVSPSGRSPAR